jgi:hypothetical protein
MCYFEMTIRHSVDRSLGEEENPEAVNSSILKANKLVVCP